MKHYILGVNITRENVSLCLLAVMKSSVAGEKTDCQAKLNRVSIKSCLSVLLSVYFLWTPCIFSGFVTMMLCQVTILTGDKWLRWCVAGEVIIANIRD